MSPARSRRTFSLGGAMSLVLFLSLQLRAQEAQRVDPIPEGPTAIVEALSPFSTRPDSSRVATLLAEQAETDFPATGYDRVLVARLWRRAGEPELAAASLNAVSGESDTIGLAVYESARVWLEADRVAAGIRAYGSACASTDERVRAEIFWDLLPETIPEEREAWKSLPAGEATCEWLRGFWEERARRMVIPTDRRIAIHFQRLAKARRDYHLAKPRNGGDMASDHGRPAGLAVDDRGLLYIRRGEPIYQQGCPEEHPVPPDGFVNRLGVCWVYARPPNYDVYYLTTKDRFGWTVPDGDYRIQESFSHLAEPGSLLFQKYVMHTDLPDNVKASLVARGPVDRLRRLIYLEGTAPETDFGGMKERLKPLLPEPGAPINEEYRHLFREVELATRRSTSAALEQIPDAPALELTADMRFETLRFLNPSQREWQVWLLAGVSADQLARSTAASEDGPGTTIDVAGRFSVMTPDGMRIQDITPISLPAASVPPGAGIPVRGATSAAPGPLPFTFVVEDLNRDAGGSWIQDTVQVPRIGGLPQLSDIAVAQATGGSWTRDGETYLQVTPAHVTNPDGSIHTYFEVYGVDPGTRYDVEFRMVRDDDAERIWRIETGDLAFRLQFSSQMTGDIGRHHLRLDLSGTEPGEYVLGVRIQDESSKAYSLPSVIDLFVSK